MIRQGNDPADSETGLSGGWKNCKMGKSDNTKRVQEKRKGFTKKTLEHFVVKQYKKYKLAAGVIM